MESRTKILGHSAHQILVVFPVTLFTATVLLDVVALMTRNPYWYELAFWANAAAVVTAILAAPFGARDWWAIPAGTRAKRVGAIHGIGNIFVVALFGMSWAMRGANQPETQLYATVLAVAGGVLAMVTAWLGGELVERLGVGIHEGANLNAPSSLSRRPSIGK